jgi:hypothetical protein
MKIKSDNKRKLLVTLFVISFSLNSWLVFAATEMKVTAPKSAKQQASHFSASNAKNTNYYKGKISRKDNNANTGLINLASTEKGNVNKVNVAEIKKSNSKVILFVWDGLRADIISPEYTPNLYKLKQQGTFFSDHHASYPTITMNNANSLATGNYYSNWSEPLNLKNSINTTNTKDIKLERTELEKLAHNQSIGNITSLLQVAKKYGLKTAQVGKAEPVNLQDTDRASKNSIVLTSDMIYPFAFTKELVAKGYNLPQKVAGIYATEELVVDKSRLMDMKDAGAVEVNTIDGNVPLVGLSDPQATTDAVAKLNNDYFMDIFLKEILPSYQPDVSIIWLGEPDSTAHVYGPGSKPYYTALANQDALLGKLLLYMDKLGHEKDTNLLVVSDHGHSNVSADVEIFPLREIKNSSIGDINKDGYSVSGSVRVADLLTKAGFKAFDGQGCNYNPVLHGILEDRKLLLPIYADHDGKTCKEGAGMLYTTASYIVPQVMPKDTVLVAPYGGSVYIYLPDKNIDLAKQLVRFLQSRLEFDAIFIDEQYGDLPGTVSLSNISFHDEDGKGRPDILVSMSYNEQQRVQGLPGISYSANHNNSRGSHGSLSPVEIKNILIANGPDFKSNYIDVLPTANVDVPVTISYLLNLPFDTRAGRIILEAIKGSGVKASDYQLKYTKIQPSKPATDLKLQSLLNHEGKEIITDKDSYNFVLNIKQLAYKDQNYSYLDSGKAIRY